MDFPASPDMRPRNPDFGGGGFNDRLPPLDEESEALPEDLVVFKMRGADRSGVLAEFLAQLKEVEATTLADLSQIVHEGSLLMYLLVATKAKSKAVKAMLMAAKSMGFEADFRFLGNERVCVDGEVQKQEGEFVRPFDVSVNVVVLLSTMNPSTVYESLKTISGHEGNVENMKLQRLPRVTGWSSLPAGLMTVQLALPPSAFTAFSADLRAVGAKSGSEVSCGMRGYDVAVCKHLVVFHLENVLIG